MPSRSHPVQKWPLRWPRPPSLTRRLLLTGLLLLLSPSRGSALDREGQRDATGVPSSREERKQLTLVDLSDAFVPPILAAAPESGDAGSPTYASTVRALSDERWDDATRPAPRDGLRYLELFGIFPNLRVLRERLLDDTRHACHQGVDRAPLRDYPPRLSLAGEPVARPSDKRKAAVAVVQAILRCDGLLGERYPTGQFDFPTLAALRLFQRRNMLPSPPMVDDTTRAALLASSLERDFDAALRTLRERVAAATGLIEDGSASGDVAQVVGRVLDAPALRGAAELPPLTNAAADLIGRATDAAARSLGWTSPDATRAWFLRLDPRRLATLHIELPLPSPPDYHGAHMQLRAEIDRGDVWYDYPFGPSGARRTHPDARRPTLVLYAQTESGEIALMRWNTTVGGFQPEQLDDGQVVFRYKNSDTGPCVWRELIAAPTWLPPDSTPDAELVRPIGEGRYALKRDAFGPGFESAYGIVMLRHELVQPTSGEGPGVYQDRGVRSHGSVHYRSVLEGQSHGCHRLFNHLALRLGAFLLAHRSHERRGALPVRYTRVVRYRNVHAVLNIDSRGYGYELTPPVPVVVLEGRVRSARKQPPTGNFPVPPGFHF